MTVIVYALAAMLNCVTSEHVNLNFVRCIQPLSNDHRCKSKSDCSVSPFRAIPTKRVLSRSRDLTRFMSASDKQSEVKGDVLSALQNLDAELQEAIRREEYTVASSLKRQIEEMRRDVSLGI